MSLAKKLIIASLGIAGIIVLMMYLQQNEADISCGLNTDTKRYVAEKERCPLVFYSCEGNEQSFSDTCGCGCETVWGPIIEGVQLSIDISPRTLSLFELKSGKRDIRAVFKARNFNEETVIFDAGLPNVNESEIHITEPDGTKILHSLWNDAVMNFPLEPGQHTLGEYIISTLVGTWSFVDYEKRTLESAKRGTYQITWKLNGLMSNTLEFYIK